MKWEGVLRGLVWPEAESDATLGATTRLASLREGVRRVAELHAADALSARRLDSDNYSDDSEPTC